MNGNPANDKWAERLANTKDGMDIARQLIIVTVIVVLIFQPTAFRSTLAALGIKKIGIAGADIEVAQEATANAGDAAQRLEEATKTTKSTLQQLDAAIQSTDNPEQKKKLEEAKAGLSKTIEATNIAEQKLNSSIAAQSTILQSAEAQDVQASGAWGIVISADKDKGEAQFEVKNAQGLGFQNVKLYTRQNWYRTVVEFPNFTEAQAALPKLRSFHNSSYLVNINKWCSPRSDQGNGIWQCPDQ